MTERVMQMAIEKLEMQLRTLNFISRGKPTTIKKHSLKKESRMTKYARFNSFQPVTIDSLGGLHIRSLYY